MGLLDSISRCLWPKFDRRTVRTIGDKLNFEIDDLELEEEGIFINLKDVVIIINDNTERNKKGAINPWLEIIKEKSAILRSLNIFYCHSYEEYVPDYSIGEDRHLGSHNWISSKVKKLAGMDALEDLTLYSNGNKDIRVLGESLESLINLRKLTLNYGASEEPFCWDKSFPFSSLSYLTEFRLILHLDMKALPWGKVLAENLSNLSHLKVLEIVDKTDQTMALKTFYHLIKELDNLKNLRRLVIKTLLKRLMMEEWEDFVFIVGKEAIENGERNIFEEIKANIRRLIQVTPTLEELDIGRLEGYSITHILYNKKMLKE